jgi:NTE family protein
MKKVGLALGSGGARGFAHIGVINILEENKIPIDYVSGTSIGSVVAAYYALNLNVEGLKKVSLNFKSTDIWKTLIDLNNPKISLIKGKKLRKYWEQFFGNKRFKDTKIPLAIGATDATDGSRVVFTRGRILDAVIASSTLPGIFPPSKKGGKILIDGGIADGLPVDIVRELGADVVIGVDLYNFKKKKLASTNTLDIMERTYNILISKLSTYQEHEYKKNIVVLRPDTGNGVQLFAFDKVKQNIKIGELEAIKYLKKIKRLVK